MQTADIQHLATMRVVVGFLGEREQHGWWSSSFFAPTSRAFLAPVFGRTQLLAQCSGATRAANMVHDDRIGVGRVFHLFRLPEAIEEVIHQALQHSSVAARITPLVANTDAALHYLQHGTRLSSTGRVGPTHIGNAADLRSARVWRDVATYYAQGFATGTEVYPFFADQL